MGAYVNPIGEEKEVWLEREGNLITEHEAATWDWLDWGEEHKERFPVCLVDNGPFTAAGIGFCQKEIDEFIDLSDLRPRKWYSVPIDKLLESSDLKYLWSKNT